MSRADKEIRQKEYVKPFRIYDEMAELGVLEDFLERMKKHNKELNEEFHDEMLEVLYKRSAIAVPEGELLNLERISSSLENFLEKTTQWRIRKH